AQGTHTWKQNSFDDFEKGTAKGVAITSDGLLQLAPAFKAVYTTPSTYVWALAADGSGAVYAAAGSPARVYRVTPDGKAAVIFEPRELQVQALVVDRSGLLYAATSPDGKVYRIEHGGAAGKTAAKTDQETQAAVDASYKSSVFFDPQTKYIWDLAIDPQDQLYIATGDRGEIYRVNRAGQGTLFFKSDEAHIRVLGFDAKGNLIAGSDGSGLVYRISPAGEAFVLYSAPKKEITALAVDAAGNIYAAGVGEKRTAAPVPGPAVAPPPQPQPQPGPQPPSGGAPPPVNPPAAGMPMPRSAGSEIYRIAPDGSPRRIWWSVEDIVYALGFDEQGRLLAGTGNKGRIYLVQNERSFTDLLKASATQVTAFAKAPGGGLYASTSNLGKIFSIGVAPEAEGSYESDVFDARIFSRWGRVESRGQGRYEIDLRSGNVDNPDRNWSPWKRVDPETGEADVPAARFIQWKAVLRPAAQPTAVDSVLLNYRPNNVAPVIDDVAVQVGWRFQPMPKPPEGAQGGQRFAMVPAGVRDRDAVSVRWVAHDDNDDELVYSLYYRGNGESRWKLLKDKITDTYYTLDGGLLPDGGYTIRVVASDAPSHPADEALSDARESARFEVDNTPPRIDDLHASGEGGQVHITFRARDSFSPISHAECSIDAGEWQFIEPVGKISDSLVENYDFALPLPSNAPPAPASGGKKTDRPAAEAPGEHVVVVRAYDRFENMGAAKTIVTSARK
ncbi:MAG TPA: hypothetical protein VMS96_15210, partial [Terriglobales bacterium]|nr:hypothetical protein [Terriglobales bacterium]